MIHWIRQIFSPKTPPDIPDHVVPFSERRECHGDVQFLEHGEKTVSLNRIIGSVGKYADFDARFRPRKHAAGKRFEDIRRAMREGALLPPVRLYQIRNDYFVLDGNHRVSAAKELGWTEIRARVVELLSGENTRENLLYLEKKAFFEKTGLPREIDLTEIGKYNYLEAQITQHQAYLTTLSGQERAFADAARDWFHTVFRPLVTLIENGKLIRHFPGRTTGDLYAYIAYHHWDTGSERRYGIGIDRLIPRNMADFRSKMLEKKAPEYPEMKRTITTFILLDAVISPEYHLVEDLFAIDEIQEVHTIHGSFDILVKAVLERDFLASDAEVIGEFVDQRIRSLAGVHRTQTLIPGRSLVKDGLDI